MGWIDVGNDALTSFPTCDMNLRHDRRAGYWPAIRLKHRSRAMASSPRTATQPPPLSWRKKFVFAVVTILSLALLLEAGGRLIHGWRRHWLDCHRWHPVLGWSLREGWAGKWSWTGGYSRINDQG